MKDMEFMVEKIRSQYTDQAHTELGAALGSLAMVVGIIIGLGGIVFCGAGLSGLYPHTRKGAGTDRPGNSADDGRAFEIAPAM